MITEEAFVINMASQNNEKKVFDWDKAARLIVERKPEEADAGLHSDWEWTGGTIYENGKPVMDSYTYLSSTWATPELDLDGEIIDCFVMESETEWGSGTKWPKSALQILRGEKEEV